MKYFDFKYSLLFLFLFGCQSPVKKDIGDNSQKVEKQSNLSEEYGLKRVNEYLNKVKVKDSIDKTKIKKVEPPKYVIPQPRKIPIDTLDFIQWDRFPIPESIILSSYKKSYRQDNYRLENYGGGLWFTDATKNLIMLIGFETDYHRVLQILFDKRNIPITLFKNKHLYVRKDTIYTNDFSDRYFRVPDKEILLFFKNTTLIKNIISKKYFKTSGGLFLGSSQSIALKRYGKPDSIIKIKNEEVLYWRFVGYGSDISHEKIINNKLVFKAENAFYEYGFKESDYTEKPIVIDAYYPELYLYYKNNKLIGIQIIDGVP